ncbi:MAG TPA: peptidylprolyl isomerase [Planctomycetota bacterium]|nr:peptidylprolyl isomerase [Planctomycetota bacterium]
MNPYDLNVVAEVETTAGTMVLGFFPDVAPGHVKNFVDLARKGFYDGTRFHRTLAGFMIQGGDPLTKDLSKEAMWGTGDPGYKIKAEFNSKPHVRGTLSMARSSDPNSAGSQFFICHAAAPALDNKYTVFGELLRGYDVLDKIATAPATARPGSPEVSKPVSPVQIVKVTIRARTPADVKQDG